MDDAYAKALAAALRQGLDKANHSDLVMLRKLAEKYGYAADQQLLTPFEHKAFAREYTAEHPGSAPSMFLAPAAYAAAKRLGAASGRTKPSMDQVFAGMEGAAEGLGQAIRK